MAGRLVPVQMLASAKSSTGCATLKHFAQLFDRRIPVPSTVAASSLLRR